MQRNLPLDWCKSKIIPSQMLPAIDPSHNSALQKSWKKLSTIDFYGSLIKTTLCPHVNLDFEKENQPWTKHIASIQNDILNAMNK